MNATTKYYVRQSLGLYHVCFDTKTEGPTYWSEAIHTVLTTQDEAEAQMKCDMLNGAEAVATAPAIGSRC